jgi:hypothetical protein
MLRGVWVQPDARGGAYSWVEDGLHVRLRLPASPGDFSYENEKETVQFPALSPTATIENSGTAHSVDIVLVEVDVEADATMTEKRAAKAAYEQGNADPWDEFMSRAGAAWERGHKTAERAAARWLSHIRVSTRQPWLGLTVDPLEQYGRSYLLDPEVSDDIMVAFGPMQSVTIRSGSTAMTRTELDEVAGELAEGKEPNLAATLLADALFLSREAEVIDSQRTILSAASACEIKTKNTLRENVDAGKALLLDLAVSKMSALSTLLNKPYEAVFGISLAQEDTSLYQRMQRLNKLRDKVIHRGDSVDATEAWQLAVAAQQLFSHFANKSSSPPGSPASSGG